MIHPRIELRFLNKEFLSLCANLVIWTKPEFELLLTFTCIFEILQYSLLLNIVINTEIAGSLQGSCVI